MTMHGPQGTQNQNCGRTAATRPGQAAQKKEKRMKPTWLSSKISLLKCRTDLASPSFHTCACMLSTLQLVIAVRAGGGPGSRTPSATKIREADGARNKILTGPSCVRKFPFVREFCFCQDRTHTRGASGSCGSNAPPEVAFPSGPPVRLAPAAAVSAPVPPQEVVETPEAAQAPTVPEGWEPPPPPANLAMFHPGEYGTCPVCGRRARWESRRQESEVILAWYRCTRWPHCEFAWTHSRGVLPPKTTRRRGGPGPGRTLLISRPSVVFEEFLTIATSRTAKKKVFQEDSCNLLNISLRITTLLVWISSFWSLYIYIYIHIL